MTTPPPTLPPLPLVGRSDDLHEITVQLERALKGRGSAVLLTGEGGVGKSRLVEAVAEEAQRREWTVASGGAYPVEVGVPYALLSDALVPPLRAMDDASLTVLARGTEDQIVRLFPALRPGAEIDGPAPQGGSVTQLYWSLTQFLRAWAERGPLLVVLDDLHWADASSLELLHFLCRQLQDDPVAFLVTINVAERESNATLRQTERSLLSLGVAESYLLEPLTPADTDELVRQAFGLDPSVTREFTALLYGWTRGNPFFIEEALKTLVESERLRRERGSWLGWELDRLELPRSVREAVLLRLDRLSDDARAVLELGAVVGTRVRYSLLKALAGLDEPRLIEALDELQERQLLVELDEDGRPVYDFRHPMVRQTLTSRISLARRRMVHGRIAEALEALYGERAAEHADELALHFLASADDGIPDRAVHHLVTAGRRALARYANQEAARYLTSAVEHLHARNEPAEDVLGVVHDLARARQRLGEFDAAIDLWTGARAQAAELGDRSAEAATLRRIGLAHFFGGRLDDALPAFDAGIAAAVDAGDAALEGRIRMARGMGLQAVGRVDEAHEELQRALQLAEDTGNRTLSAGVHRALLLFHTWSGPAQKAREHGHRALAFAEEADDLASAGTCHWALAVLEGLTGQADPLRHHIARAEALAEEMHSPLLSLAIAEVAVEFAYGLGEWDSGLALGERMIALGRSLNQRSLLPRLLVWTGLIYLGRGEMERARELFDDAWEVSGAGHDDRPLNLHGVVPAHIGMASYHLVDGDNDSALAVGQAALELVERTGYRMWAAHRLLPTIAEALLDLRDLERARRVADRLLDDATSLENRSSIAWAQACRAILTWLEGDVEAAVDELRAAAEGLEGIPYLYEAARIRRQLAGRLAELDRRDEAVKELRAVHDLFLRLGAAPELDKTRKMLHEVGSRPPARTVGQGPEGLTGREMEIVQLVAARKSNKAIAKELGIAHRTVGTHLTNIFRKLEVGSREELAEVARTLPS